MRAALVAMVATEQPLLLTYGQAHNADYPKPAIKSRGPRKVTLGPFTSNILPKIPRSICRSPPDRPMALTRPALDVCRTPCY
jgi:hypothetical protein